MQRGADCELHYLFCCSERNARQSFLESPLAEHVYILTLLDIFFKYCTQKQCVWLILGKEVYKYF